MIRTATLILACLAALELTSLAVVYNRDGAFFYLMGQTASQPPGFFEMVSSPRRIHPYLGYARPKAQTVADVVLRNDRLTRMTGKPGYIPDWTALTTNNHGFWSNHNYPHSDEAIIVGVFGGSVAQWLCVQQGDYLAKQLRTALRSKRVTVLNFATGGYKQPQQLLAFSYFLSIGQRFDLLLNIDGFNEVVLPEVENKRLGVDASLPRSYPTIVSALTSIANAQTVQWLFEIKDITDWTRFWGRLANQRFSPALHLVATAAFSHSRTELLTLRSTPPGTLTAASRQFFVAPPGKSSAVELWFRSSEIMAAIAMAHGIRYLHVLQPNQYSGRKSFTNTERSTALKPDSAYAKAVQKYYPQLREKAQRFQMVNFLDATSIFDDVDETIYADTCCHYNDAGYRVLIDAIVQALIKRLPPR